MVFSEDTGCAQSGPERPGTDGGKTSKPAPAQVQTIQFFHAETVPVRIWGDALIEEIFQ
ncbi:MAG TPA: hypothetical protein VK883_14600 [Arthrobacter sp.]|nr:hypothetical protein [Arthrobacter sp.]